METEPNYEVRTEGDASKTAPFSCIVMATCELIRRATMEPGSHYTYSNLTRRVLKRSEEVNSFLESPDY